MPVDSRSVVERLPLQLDRGEISRREFLTRAVGLGLSLGSAGMLVAACGGRESTGRNAGEGSRANSDLGPIEKELHIYNWSDYIAATTVPNFEKEFGVKVSYDTYESAEEMLAKLQAGATGYDLIMPTGYLVPVLVASDLIVPLDRKYLTNWANLSPIFQNLPVDPDNTYTVPWQWGTTGIAYRTDKLKVPVDSWGVFQDPRLHQKMTMMDDEREVIGAMLRYRGHSLNSIDPRQLAQAKKDAIEAKKHLKAYISAPVKAQLISGDVWIAQLWNGDTGQARAEQPHLAYVIPKEGCTIWNDSMCIPRGAVNKRAAHEWMNYILRPDVGAALSEATGFGTPNRAAAKIMKNPVPYPTEEELKRLEYPVDLGKDSATWDQIWTEVKSA
jgi:spermidine/putrescine-binding protein